MCNIYNSLLCEGKYCIKREHSCIARNVLQAHVSALLEVSPSRVPAFRPQPPFLCACSLHNRIHASLLFFRVALSAVTFKRHEQQNLGGMHAGAHPVYSRTFTLLGARLCSPCLVILSRSRPDPDMVRPPSPCSGA